jgi:hypothetical protein
VLERRKTVVLKIVANRSIFDPGSLVPARPSNRHMRSNCETDLEAAAAWFFFKARAPEKDPARATPFVCFTNFFLNRTLSDFAIFVSSQAVPARKLLI